MTDAFKDDTQQDPNDPFGKVEYATTHVYFDQPRKKPSAIWWLLLLPFTLLGAAFRILFALFDALEKPLLIVALLGFLVAPLLMLIYFHGAAMLFALGTLLALLHGS